MQDNLTSKYDWIKCKEVPGVLRDKKTVSFTVEKKDCINL